jgi:hypothetical protein
VVSGVFNEVAGHPFVVVSGEAAGAATHGAGRGGFLGAFGDFGVDGG